MFVVGRIIVGIGAELSSAAAPTLVAEVLPTNLRGPILGSFWGMFFAGGIIASGINYGTRFIESTWSWRIPSIIQMVPSALAMLLLPFIPESPRWLVAQGQHDHALEVLTVFHGKGDPDSADVKIIFDEIEAVLASEAAAYSHNPWLELVSTPANRRRLAIVITFGTMIQMLGNFVVSYYLIDILNQAGITNTSTQLQINLILNCWCFVISQIGAVMLDILGRRPQTLIGIVGMIVSLYMLGGLISKYGTSDNHSGIYGSIACIFLFQGFLAFSITPTTALYPTEIFPYKLRNTGIAVFRMLDTGFGLMASFVLSFAMANLGWKFYIINASYDLIFLVAVYFLWVETKGVHLEEIAVRFGDAQVVTGLSEHNSTVEEHPVNAKGI
ncbi:hypothetical protein N0V83_007470 [Neocucurbitaria cava]|uniref:Major facilitator superfamily (MFS) profile domain-containing protein n=1 Tax=Neocucurbitaria cava TaxID=798079 RepID=A0A9W8Y4F6_9PLEO|nr:hypothetical protein N0V83_007470 [Neocucurbitaria cava]